MAGRRGAAVAAVTLLALAACSAGSPATSSSPAVRPSSSPAAPTPSTSHSHPPTTSAPPKTRSAAPATSSRATPHPPPAPSRTKVVARRGAPVIVIDPGHSVAVHATDPATGLDVSDYENEPEMHDVYAVAQLVRASLVAAGYRVIMTKPTVDTPTSLLRRAVIANRAHAALALSIHDQAGSNGGIGFTAGNNIVYYQSVGTYRQAPSGKRVYFTDRAVAAVSRRYGQIFQRRRAAAQQTQITLLGSTGYNLGSRGLQPGNIWIVQLLSHVPWIYNEAGGNSAGMIGLSQADKQRYAEGLVAAVEACVPVQR